MKYSAIVPSFSLDYFRYDELLRLYIAYFGAENVLALPYEWFQHFPRLYLLGVQKIRRL